MTTQTGGHTNPGGVGAPGSGGLEPGDGVVYRSHPGAPAEDGTVVRWNDSRTLVFVLFVGDRQAKAVAQSMLERLS